MLKLILILLAVAVAVFLYTVYLWGKTNDKLTYMLILWRMMTSTSGSGR